MQNEGHKIMMCNKPLHCFSDDARRSGGQLSGSGRQSGTRRSADLGRGRYVVAGSRRQRQLCTHNYMIVLQQIFNLFPNLVHFVVFFQCKTVRNIRVQLADCVSQGL